MVRAPLHFHGRIPVPEVAPLTYRDGVTHLELVYELSEYLKNILHPSLQSTVDQVVADAERLLSDATAQYVDGVQEFQRIHDRFMSDVNASLMALNDSSVSDLVEDASSMLGQILRRIFEPYGEVHREVSERMGVVTPEELTFEHLQAAADEAAATGKTLQATGELTTDQTLYLNSAAQLNTLTLNYTGNSVAVQLGPSDGELLLEVGGKLPKIVHVGKYWERDTTGVLISNLNSCEWYIPHIDGFTVGMDVVGDDAGNVYNTFTIGRIMNNRINQRLRGIGRGWSNQNTYIGGWYAHVTAYGPRVPGTRHIQMEPSYHPVNNNIWINPSVEGFTPEYAIQFNGHYNVVFNARFEGDQGYRPRVHWGEDISRYNTVLLGYQSHLVEQFPDMTHPTNTITTNSEMKLSGAAVGSANLVLKGTSSIDDTLAAVYSPGVNDRDIQNHSVAIGALETTMKRTADTDARMRFDHRYGRVYFGNGSQEPEFGIGSYGSGVALFGFETNRAPENTTTPAKWVEIFVDGQRSWIPVYQ